MTKFLIEVVVDPRGAVTGSRTTRTELEKVEKSADKLGKRLRGAFAFLGTGLAIRELASLSDAYTNTQNRLKTVTSGTQELEFATQNLFKIANDTRSSYEATVEIYARVGLAAKELGTTQQQLLDFTKSLNQAVILSGSSASEAEAGMIQLSQGLASGALRGDELRSVLEQLPAVADIIARSLGVTRGELRTLGEQGAITADVVLRAFAQAREELDDRFAQSVGTIGQSFVRLKNNLIEYVGGANQSTGASQAVSAAISKLADNVELAVATVGTLGITFAALKLAPFIAGLYQSAAGAVAFNLAVAQGRAVVLGSAVAAQQQAAAEVEAAAATAAHTAALVAQAEAQIANAVVVRGAASNTFIEAAVQGQAAAAKVAHTEATAALTVAQGRLAVATQAATVQARILAAINPFAVATVATVAFGFALNKILNDLNDVEAAALKVTEAGNKFGLSEFGKIGADLKKTQDLVNRFQENIDNDLRTRGFANPSAIASLARYKQQLAELEGQYGALRDGTAKTVDEARKQTLAINQTADAVKDSLVVLEQEATLLGYGNREREIQRDLLGQIKQIEGSKGSAPLTDDQKEELRIALERNQRLKDEADLLDRINRPQEEFRAGISAARSALDSGKISQEQFNAELSRLLGLLGSQGGASIDFSGLLSGIEGIDTTKLDELFAKLNGPIAPSGGGGAVTEIFSPLQQALDNIRGPQERFNQTQAALDALLASNTISVEEYTRALNDAKIAAGEAGTTAEDGFSAGLAKIQNEINNTSGLVENTMVNAFHSAEDALANFAKTGKLNFAGFVDGVVADLARLLARQALVGLLNAFTGGFGGTLFGSAASSITGSRAGGGPVEAGKEYRVNEKGDEIFRPRVNGEIVPAGESALALSRQNAAPIVNVAAPAVTINNVSDPKDIENAINGPGGTAAVLNVIRKNRKQVKGYTE